MAAVPITRCGGRQSVGGQVVSPRSGEAAVTSALFERAGPPRGRGRQAERTAGVDSGYNVFPRADEKVGSTR